MKRLIKKPSIDMVGGIVVTKDTKLKYENKNVKQYLNNLVFHSVTTIKGENFESTYDTTIYLKEGDVLVFEEEGRGYIKPVEEFVTIGDAIKGLEEIRSLDEEAQHDTEGDKEEDTTAH